MISRTDSYIHYMTVFCLYMIMSVVCLYISMTVFCLYMIMSVFCLHMIMSVFCLHMKNVAVFTLSHHHSEGLSHAESAPATLANTN